MRLFFGSLSACLLLGIGVSACGSSSGSTVGEGGNGDANGAGAAGPGIILGNGNGLPGPGSGTVIDPKAACATGTASATLSGVNMFVMFDRSTSMNDRANQSGSRWQVTSKALTAFFASTQAAGLQLALRFFPHDSPAMGCNNAACDESACATPLVNLGALTGDAAPADAHEKALIDATNMSPPAMRAPGMQGGGTQGQGTPIFAALGGALQWAQGQRSRTPDENSVVVLVTDGEANGCDEDPAHIAQLAADALAANGTRTYAIGLTGSQERDMDRIAAAGGTTEGIFVSDGVNTEQELLDALGAIRGQVLDCDFPVPAAKPGVNVDLNAINVNFTSSAGVQSTLGQVASEAQCAGTQGWYYDDPAAPKRIVLCKSTCDSVTADKMAKLDILLGCATVTTVPK